MDGITTTNNHNYFMRQTLSQHIYFRPVSSFGERSQISYKNPFGDLHL